MTDKITLGGDLFFNSKTFVQVLDLGGALTIDDNKAYVDLNLNAEYRFSDRVSAFARVNNVTSTRYFRWYNYPSQRINAMLGFTFSF
jgi:outer membrane receptor protein involved in Fe transport